MTRLRARVLALRECAILPRRVLMSCCLALLLGTLIAAPAGAGRGWCWADPAKPIVTPGGNRLIVFLTIGVPGQQYIDAAARHTFTYEAKPTILSNGKPGTTITAVVTVEDDKKDGPYHVKSILSSGANATGDIYDQVSGSSGKPMTLQFTVPVP